MSDSYIICWECEAPMAQHVGIAPGWALRADGRVAACPEHTRYMPPNPHGLEAAYAEVGSPRAVEVHTRYEITEGPPTVSQV